MSPVSPETGDAVLRPYLDADLDAAVGLWWESWHSIRGGLIHPQPFDQWRARWLTEIVPTQVVVVATNAEGAVTGFAAADVEKSVLTQLFVGVSYKRRGIGRALLRWAQSLMPGGFTLCTLVENVASRRFYSQHGLTESSVQTSAVNGMATVELIWRPTPARSH
jgi:GNAT superfamily N-acetyltransferase